MFVAHVSLSLSFVTLKTSRARHDFVFVRGARARRGKCRVFNGRWESSADCAHSIRFLSPIFFHRIENNQVSRWLKTIGHCIDRIARTSKRLSKSILKDYYVRLLFDILTYKINYTFFHQRISFLLREKDANFGEPYSDDINLKESWNTTVVQNTRVLNHSNSLYCSFCRWSRATQPTERDTSTTIDYT